jgi:hypothetical protein
MQLLNNDQSVQKKDLHPEKEALQKTGSESGKTRQVSVCS